MTAARRRWRGARLVPAAALTWGCAALAVCVPETAVWIAGALVAVAVCSILILLRRRSRFVLVVTLACLGAALAVTQVVVAQPGRAAVDDLAGGNGRVMTVDAVISGKLEATGAGDLWFDIVATRIAAGKEAVAGPFPVRVGVGADHIAALEGADIGSTLEVKGAVIPADPGERAVLVLRAHEVVVAGGTAALPLQVAADLRHRLIASAAGLPGDGAGLVPGLAVGDTSAIDPRFDDSMKASSLSHLTAVSGANCALVVGVAYGAAALCRARRGVRVGVALASLSAFVLLVTPEPSVVRAGAMAAIAMLALALGRQGMGLSVLCLAVVVLLAVDPWLAVSLGFGLSTVATASLLVLAKPLAEGLTRWMPKALAFVLSIPLAAQLACGPLLVLVDPHVPALGVAANLLAGPAAPLATLVGLAACLAAPVPWLQDGLTAIAWLPASWIAGVAHTVSGIPAQQIPWWGDLGGAIALAVVSACVAAVIALRPGAAPRRAARGIAMVVLCTVVGVAGGQSLLRTAIAPLTVPVDWSVAACDIGQGDAVLIRSHDHVALVDTGPDPALLTACLDRFGLPRVDLLVLTHFDLDHVGGVSTMVGRADLVVHGPTDGAAAERMLRDLADGGARTVHARPGMQGVLGEARWQVLWPEPSAAPGNDASVVLDVRGGGVPDMLLLGDLSAEAQRSVQRAQPLGRYEVVKVAHHGSADQDEGLYRATRPALAVVTVGEGNDYGHPRDSILSLLTSLGTTIARTDREGVLALRRSDDGTLHVWRERDVAPAG